MTWDQLQELTSLDPCGAVGQIIELKVTKKGEHPCRQSAYFADRVGCTHKITSYADSNIPGFNLSQTWRWKNPRFHYFVDGQIGARIEEGDIANITFS